MREMGVKVGKPPLNSWLLLKMVVVLSDPRAHSRWSEPGMNAVAVCGSRVHSASIDLPTFIEATLRKGMGGGGVMDDGSDDGSGDG